MLSYKNVVLALCLFSSQVLAAPINRQLVQREVPQEHSHEAILTAVRASLLLNNPDKIQDPVFALLGNAAAITGAGNIADATCLQQATADQAFSNAKAANDVAGQTSALIFRALERNSAKVGQKTDLCTSIKAVNPEIAAITQHQDPASEGAAATNKAIILELAKQIASIGGDPQEALKAGTFAPGDVNDNTGKGNTCDDANDPAGCIFTLNLIVEDATAAEIDAAVAGVAAPGAGAGAGNADTGAGAGTGADATATCPPVATVTVTAAAGDATAAPPAATPPPAVPVGATPPPPNAPGAAPAPPKAPAAGAAGNLQKFAGALGGVKAPAVAAGGRGFQVADNADFLNVSNATTRSCDVQKNKCANAANASKTAGFTVGDCEKQQTECEAANV